MFIEKSLEEFTQELKSNSPVPGGGGVAALNSALGTAQIMMVINHTLGKAEFAKSEAMLSDALNELEGLRVVLLNGIDEDAKSFGEMAKAFKLSQTNDEEKELRANTIAKASIKATEAPLEVMKSSVRALEICEGLVGETNPNLASDLLVAAHSLDAGLKSAKLNVDANIAYLKKENAQLAKSVETLSKEILNKREKLIENILNKTN